MQPDQWDTNEPPRAHTEDDMWEHIVACFHFLLADPKQRAQKYTAAELAAAIRKHYEQVNSKVVSAVAFLEERADTFLTIRNY